MMYSGGGKDIGDQVLALNDLRVDRAVDLDFVELAVEDIAVHRESNEQKGRSESPIVFAPK